MRLETVHRGGERPFEGERQLTLRGLPANALVQRATATITPAGGDGAGRFVESIAFDGELGEWGATATAQGTAVEVAFHARRTLAAVSGQSVTGSLLLVDLGGGFVPVDTNGAFGGGGAQYPVPPDGTLPGLTVAGFRLANASSVAEVRVRSAPSNVTLALAGGPPLFAMVGDLVGPVTTPDFALLLADFLARAEVRHGAFEIPLVVRSDTIARLDVALTIDYLELADIEPPGVGRVSIAYQYGTEPDATAGLAVSLPPGTAAVPGATAGRVQGGFDSSRVVAGEKGAVPVAARVSVTAGAPQAQPLVLDSTTLATSIDVQVASVSASARVKLDVLEDLDGKPGGRSLLAQAAGFQITRDDAPDLTWVNVALPAEFEFAAAARHWVALLAEEGEVSWGAATDAGVGPGLHQTADGGLSWRPTPHPTGTGTLAANLRLRHVPGAFSMPLELHVGNGDAPQRVGLERFAPERRVDLRLDFPEFAGAINDALAADSSGECSPEEHVRDGDFTEWLRLGDEVGVPIFEDHTLDVDGVPGCVELTGDGRTAFVVTRGDVPPGRVYVIDTVCRSIVADIEVQGGVPTAFAATADGRLGVLAIRAPAVFTTAAATTALGAFQLVDLEQGRLTGAPVPYSAVVTALAIAPDGDTVYVGHDDDAVTARLRALSLADLEAAARSGEAAAEPEDGRTAVLDERPIRIVPAADGRVFVLGSALAGNSRVHVFAAGFRNDDDAIATVGDVVTPRDLALSRDGTTLLVAAEGGVTVVDSATLAATTGPAEFTAAAVFEPSGSALVAGESELHRLRPGASTLAATGVAGFLTGMRLGPEGGQLVAIDSEVSEVRFVRIGVPAPIDWELTAGMVEPICFGRPRRPAALLGTISQTGAPAAAAFPSAVNQIMAVQEGCAYRFAFDGVAQFEGAVAELRWIGDGCEPLAGKPVVVPITLAPEDGEVELDRHEVVATAPAGAVRAELRIATAEGAAVITGVSLRGSQAAVANPTFRVDGQAVRDWTASGAPTVAAAAGATVVRNDGSSDIRLAQEADLDGEQRFALRGDARPVGRGDVASRLELAFSGADGGAVGEPVVVELGPDAFPDSVARGPVPAGATMATVAVVVPPRAAVELGAVDVAFDSARSVPLTFVADSPGELAVTGLRVPYEDSPAEPPPPPPGDPCRPTPPGACDDEVKPGTCFCRKCQSHQPIRRPATAIVRDDRAVTVAECAQCGTTVTGVIGAEHDHRLTTEAVVLNVRPTSSARPATGTREIEPAVAVDAVKGIGARFSSELANRGITNLRELSRAQPTVVASVRGISLRQAVGFVARARELTAEERRARRRSVFARN